MSQLEFITLLQQTMILILQLAAPVIIVSMVVGLMISVFQSVTQIQESTLTFVPKIIAGIITIIMLTPWMLGVYMNTVNEMFANMQNYIR